MVVGTTITNKVITLQKEVQLIALLWRCCKYMNTLNYYPLQSITNYYNCSETSIINWFCWYIIFLPQNENWYDSVLNTDILSCDKTIKNLESQKNNVQINTWQQVHQGNELGYFQMYIFCCYILFLSVINENKLIIIFFIFAFS